MFSWGVGFGVGGLGFAGLWSSSLQMNGGPGVNGLMNAAKGSSPEPYLEVHGT